MDRVRGEFAAATKADYDDPLDVLTEDLGFFEKDSGLAPTQWTVDHANLITEELRNLVVGLGHTPASDDDEQLANAIGPALLGVSHTYHAANGRPTGLFTIDDADGSASAGYVGSGSSHYAYLDRLPVGSRIRSFGAYADSDGTTDLPLLELERLLITSGATTTEVIDTLTASWTTTPARFDKTLADEGHTVADNYAYRLRFRAQTGWDGTLCRIHVFFVTLDLTGAP